MLARRGCKVSLCESARSKEVQGESFSCMVLKTWPDVDLKTKVLKSAMDWPFGHAQ